MHKERVDEKLKERESFVCTWSERKNEISSIMTTFTESWVLVDYALVEESMRSLLDDY